MARTFVAASSQYLHNASWSYSTLPITMACWFRTTGTGAQTIFTLTSGDANPSLGFEITGTKVGGYIVDNAGTMGEALGATPATDTWIPIATVELGTSRTLYQSGSTYTDSTSLSAGSMTRVSVAAYRINATAVNFLGGMVAECAVWKAALTANEIAAFSAGVRAYNIRPNALIDYWPIDGIESPEPDIYGSALNLTLVNTPTIGAGPPMTLFSPRRPMFMPGAAAATFVPAWAQGTNYPVLGTGNF